MNGSDYVAVRRISNKANATLAAVGATCERVPESALPGLEARGAIRHVPQVKPPAEKSAIRMRRPPTEKGGE